jgi:hypothetical protein
LLTAGQTAGGIREILPVAEIMRRLVAETEAALSRVEIFRETAAHGALVWHADPLISPVLDLDQVRQRYFAVEQCGMPDPSAVAGNLVKGLSGRDRAAIVERAFIRILHKNAR